MWCYSLSLGRNVIIYCTKWVAIEKLLFVPVGDGYCCMVPACFSFMVPTTIINKKYLQSVLWLRTQLASKLLESHGADGKTGSILTSLLLSHRAHTSVFFCFAFAFFFWLVRVVLLVNKWLIKLWFGWLIYICVKVNEKDYFSLWKRNSNNLN